MSTTQLPWIESPEEEGRYLWRLHSNSSFYQICYIIKVEDILTSFSLSAQNMNSEFITFHDNQPTESIEGEWLFLSPRFKLYSELGEYIKKSINDNHIA